MRVLLVKLTSMGDLIHAWPALTDAQQAFPDIEFDWVADEAFAEIASWHPAVKNVIKSAHRRWKKNIKQTLQSGEIINFVKTLRQNKYDLVIDGQGNIKSAIITFLSRGTKCGFDKESVREYPAHWAYHKKFHHPRQDHAITRLRSLFAQALGYPTPSNAPRCNIQPEKFVKPDLNLPEKYIFFVHSASWVTKLWPEEYWRELIKIATDVGHHILLPAGNAEEIARSQRLAAGNDKAIVLPRMRLAEVAYLLARAQGSICVDTGLSHLSAALEIPAVTIYGATDAGLIGATSEHSKQIHLQSKFPCAPCYLKECAFKGPSKVKPACYEELNPQLVWEKFLSLL